MLLYSYIIISSNLNKDSIIAMLFANLDIDIIRSVTFIYMYEGYNECTTGIVNSTDITKKIKEFELYFITLLLLLIQVGNRLYACGGSDGFTDLRSAEYLDLGAKSWVKLPDMKTSRSSAG